MTDTALQTLMDKTSEALRVYKILLKQLEGEYENRIGYHPSDIDDDYFIDEFHYGNGNTTTVKKMLEEANLHRPK